MVTYLAMQILKGKISYAQTIETLKINILNEKSEREKFKNFCIHNGKSINKYINKYDLSRNMFFNLINDIPNFDRNLDIYINR